MRHIVNIRPASYVVILLLVLPALAHKHHAQPAAPEFDLIIIRGRIVDGTGNPWFEADLAVKDGRIASIGHIAADRAARRIDAGGLIVAPGFIDVHTHIESGIEARPTADNFLHMGVTSVITGNCGGSALPLGEWFSKLEKGGVSINIGSLVGHNTVRRAGMKGDFDRPPAPEELQRMRELIDGAMRDGAVGLSTGLEYVPGAYAKTDEIVELAKVAASYGGIYATHMRNEDETVEQSISESLQVGAAAKCPVEISHFKISSKKRWGASSITTRMVEAARAGGQQVTVDQYLYTAGSTGIGILFPSWIFEGGPGKTKERLQTVATRARIKREMIEKAGRGGFKDFSFAYVASYKANPAFNGKNVSEISLTVRQKSGVQEEAEQAIEMLLAGGAQMVLHKMSDEDVARIFRAPFTMVASDSGVLDPDDPSIPHPRGFGNNARVLGLYVREKRMVSLEEAVRKMTSLPAQTFGLWERGLLRPGLAADIVIFNDKTISDRSSYQQPKQYADGVDYVLVNGQVVIDKGQHNGTKLGRILRRSK
ncbi:MAG: D-aminoacylase [Acidobacteriota bacterium]